MRLGETVRGLWRLVAAAGLMNADWNVTVLLAEAACRIGDRAAAAKLYALLAPHARLFPVVARGVVCYGSGEYVVGRLAATLGRFDEAEARLRTATRANESAGAAPYAALALTALGHVLAARGNLAEARDKLHEAVARAHTLDMPTLASYARDGLNAWAPA